MRERGSYIVAGAFGVLALGAAITAGYWNDRHAVKTAGRIEIGSKVSERQAMERRRARAADVAIAGTTTL